ncbi:MAG: FGGY family carbohydrate kinase [Candidatus Bathyarchaeia archaeon]
MGIDLGTSACKVVIFTLNGRKVSEASKEYPVLYPQPRWAEQDPLDWWGATTEAIKASIRKAGMVGNEIAGLAVDSQREAVVPINKDGDALYNSIIWLDKRTGPQMKRIRELLDQEKVLSITGIGIDPVFSASKILWLKERVPEVFENTECFLCAKDYIIYKLTGEKVTDYSMASRTMLLDVRRRIWSEEICSALEIPVDKLPPLRESSSVVGEVSSKASDETSLPMGLPVVNGGGDRPCECLGAGVTQEGFVNIGTGTGSAIEAPLQEPRIDMKGRINCCCHVIPDMWEYEAPVATTGAALRWFRDLFGREEMTEAQRSGKDPYDILIERASEVSLGADGLLFYPYLAGAFPPRINGRARAVFFGISLSHNKGHFVRAMLEGIAFQYLGIFEIFRDLGIEIKEVSMVGGETRSEFWNQLKADVTGCNIRVPEVEDAAAMGSALLAGKGTGQYPSLERAVEEVVRSRKVYTPNPENHLAYLKFYKNYEMVYSFIKRCYEIY